MGIFNRNIVFLRQKKGFKSVQKFADYLGEPRSKLVEYEKETLAKVDFLAKLAAAFQLDLNMFLNEEINDGNYALLFRASTNKESGGQEDTAVSPEFYDVMHQLRNELDKEKRSQLIQQAISLYSRKVELISDLKDELLRQMKQKEELFKRL